MRKVGILGGTFNPPHIGHLIVANEVRHALNLDEVRLMPTAVPPHKKASVDATAMQRLRMVELAVADMEGLSVSSFEVERGGISYTFDTMKELTMREPDNEFFFIIGGDMLDMMTAWYRIDELVKLVNFVGVRRPGSEGTTKYKITMVDIPQIDLSSTLIRNRCAEDGSIALLTPPIVEKFIREEGLYGCRNAEK
jgi:nicotinate-nucleotide adenylyltransferase